MVLPEPVLAFKLLGSAGLSQKKRQLVLTATSTLDFSSMKSALKRILGGSTVSNTGNINVKEELVYLTSYGSSTCFKRSRVIGKDSKTTKKTNAAIWYL